jgi:DNA-directed RNA polymerase subunit RPC12/RpoP
MAELRRFVCGHCNRAVEAWSDGNPYYFDAAGARHYAYHPDHHNLGRCVGNDEPHLCLDCGHPFVVDSRNPVAACPECASSQIRGAFDVEGCRCPWCNSGVFRVDPEYGAIS